MKKIKTNKGIELMSFTEVYTQFAPMMHKYAKTTLQKNISHNYKEEDILQELSIDLWNCYKNYDINKGICFSTILTTYFKNRIGMIYRKVECRPEFLVYENEGNSEENAVNIFDTVGEEDKYFEDAKNLINAVAKNEKEKNIMVLLASDVDKKEIASRLGISRSGLYKTVDKLKGRIAKYYAE